LLLCQQQPRPKTLAAWASTGFGDTSIAAGDEIDLYASYNFGLSDTVSLDAGVTYYHYPQGGSLSDKSSFDLGATVGLVDGDGFSYEYGSASAALGYALSDNTSAYVGGNFAVNSDDALNFSRTLAGDPKSSLVWFGAGISAGF